MTNRRHYTANRLPWLSAKSLESTRKNSQPLLQKCAKWLQASVVKKINPHLATMVSYMPKIPLDADTNFERFFLFSFMRAQHILSNHLIYNDHGMI